MTASEIHVDVAKMSTSGCKSGDVEIGAGLDGDRSTPRDPDIASLTSGMGQN